MTDTARPVDDDELSRRVIAAFGVPGDLIDGRPWVRTHDEAHPDLPAAAPRSNEFRCDRCHRTFTKGWSDEAALAEAAARFGAASTDDDPALLCDACYRLFLAWWHDQKEN